MCPTPARISQLFIGRKVRPCAAFVNACWMRFQRHKPSGQEPGQQVCQEKIAIPVRARQRFNCNVNAPHENGLGEILGSWIYGQPPDEQVLLDVTSLGHFSS
jgi:hypothetical protein